MYKYCQYTRQGWRQVENLIQHWLGQRAQLLRFSRSIMDPAGTGTEQIDVTTKVKVFCQTLMDYLSAGHFSIYQILMEQTRGFDDDSLSRARELYVTAQETTTLALCFNDKFDNDENCRRFLHELATDMVVLGQALQLRFEIEDRLIEALHACHRGQVLDDALALALTAGRRCQPRRQRE